MSKRKGMFGNAKTDTLVSAEPDTAITGQIASDEAIGATNDFTPDDSILNDIDMETTSRRNSNMPELQVKYVNQFASEIGYATDGSAGIDLRCYMDGCRGRGARLTAGVVTFFGTGVAVAIPSGYVGLIVMRSSKSAKDGILLANQVSVIDSDYRGEIKLPLTTDRTQGVYIANGERVAQLLIVPCATAKITRTDDVWVSGGKEYIGQLEILGQDTLGIRVVEELPATERGEGGFGSTGN